MAKKYKWVILILMVIAMFVALVERKLNKEPEIKINTENSYVKNNDLQSSSDSVTVSVIPGVTDTTPKGKLPAGSTPSGDIKAVQGISWIWDKTVMNNDTVVSPKKPGVFTLELKADGNLSGRTDCNGFFGEYKIASDGIISVGPLASTMMYCDGSQEKVYTDAISKASRYIVDANGNLVLLLPYDSGSIIFKK